MAEPAPKRRPAEGITRPPRPRLWGFGRRALPLSARLPGPELRWPRPRRVLRDLALCLADGGDCVSDLGALRDQPDLFGRVASNATAWRAIERTCGRLDDLRAARAKARERAWQAEAAPTQIVLDFDSHLVTAHSDKEGATPTWKGGFSSDVIAE